MWDSIHPKRSIRLEFIRLVFFIFNYTMRPIVYDSVYFQCIYLCIILKIISYVLTGYGVTSSSSDVRFSYDQVRNYSVL